MPDSALQVPGCLPRRNKSWASGAVVGCSAFWLCKGRSKIAEAEAAVSVNEKKWLVMHMHVQLKLDELWGPPTLGSL
jgi:hypothetical protein